MNTEQVRYVDEAITSRHSVRAFLDTPVDVQTIKDVMQRFAIPAQVRVLKVTNLDLVPFVEQGAQMSEACLSSLQHSLQPVVDQGADYLVLGCTHYPFLKPAIESIFGQKLTLIDSGIAVARQTSRILIKNELLFDQSVADTLQIACYVSGNNAEQLKPVLQHLIPGNISWSIANVSTVD